MLLYVMLTAVAIAATFHKTDGKLDLNENDKLDNYQWPGERMEIMEKQMKKFGDIIKEQGKKMEKAENEIDKLKATIQTQEIAMKLMENKLDKCETIVNEQWKKLNDKERNIQDLERAVINQDKEIDRIKDDIITMKGNSQIKPKEKTNANVYNKYKERKIEETRKEANRKSDSIVSFLGVPEQGNSGLSNLTTESLTKMSSPPSGQISGKLIGTFIKAKNQKISLKEMVSRQHQKQRQISSGVAFSAYLSHNINNMSIGFTIKCDQVLLNDGNAYSPYSGTFTAPKTGVYLLTFYITAVNLGDRTHVKLVSNNVNIIDAVVSVKDSWHFTMGGNTAIVRLNSGDRVWMEIYDTAGVELYSRLDYRWVTFSGVLLYS